uniref:Mitochondrial inner membrane protease ATP23 n=1 Tax=Globisporangium ultimum (strain ATCC 200006 / CBS 805.95 / DAOM BR144) TaxID=431595 RepID=K3WBI6_GLOUD
MEVYECEDAVHAALKQRRPKLIVDIINKHLVEEAKQTDAVGSAKKKSIDFVCIECKDDGPEGRARAFFSAPPPTIVFCANRLHSAREVEETMVHELIHAYDFTVRKMDITKSDLLACSEIRSARESECYQKAHILASMLPDVEFFRKSSNWLHTRCVREHAVRSTKSMFPNQARADVDKMFDQCYHDKSPFPQ